MSASIRMAMGVFIAATLLTGCRETTTQVYLPGYFVVSLVTPFADDGAVLIRLQGLPPWPVDVTTENRGLVVHSARNGDTLRIAVFGTLTSGPLVRIGPLDASTVVLIDTRVEEAASQGNEQRAHLSGYSVELHRQR
jgi:hypothetical protein